MNTITTKQGNTETQVRIAGAAVLFVVIVCLALAFAAAASTTCCTRLSTGPLAVSTMKFWTSLSMSE